jgi:hypothetical protein
MFVALCSFVLNVGSAQRGLIIMTILSNFLISAVALLIFLASLIAAMAWRSMRKVLLV